MTAKQRIDSMMNALREYQRPITAVCAFGATFVGYFSPDVPADKLAVMASIGGLYMGLRSLDKRAMPPPLGPPKP